MLLLLLIAFCINLFGYIRFVIVADETMLTIFLKG